MQALDLNVNELGGSTAAFGAALARCTALTHLHASVSDLPTLQVLRQARSVRSMQLTWSIDCTQPALIESSPGELSSVEVQMAVHIAAALLEMTQLQVRSCCCRRAGSWAAAAHKLRCCCHI